jgi:hypothetical protein
MAHRHHLPAWALVSPVALAAVAACSPRLDLPAHARVQCDDQTGCPSGFTCNAELGVCISNDDPDRQAPSLVGRPLITPDIGKAGSVFGVTFEVDEALGKEPVVGLALPNAATALLERSDSGASSNVYTYRYEALGTEGVTEAALSIALVDDSGNAVSVDGGMLRFDFVSPEVQSFAWLAPLGRSVVNPAEQIAFAAAVSADAVEARAELVDEEESLLAAVYVIVNPETHIATGGADLASLDLHGKASVRLRLVARDRAGNEGQAIGPALAIDGVAPTARLDAVPPAVSTDIAPAFGFSSADPDVHHYRCLLNGSAIDPCVSPLSASELPLGANSLAVWATDVAGNEQPSPTTHTWTIVRQWREVTGGREHTCARPAWIRRSANRCCHRHR